jgi:hypothetical protein
LAPELDLVLVQALALESDLAPDLDLVLVQALVLVSVPVQVLVLVVLLVGGMIHHLCRMFLHIQC